MAATVGQRTTNEKPKQAYSPLREFIKKFLKQKMAVVAFWVVVGIILLGCIAPLIVPYDPDRPVTSQYPEKGIELAQMTNTQVRYQLLNGVGQPVTTRLWPQVINGNRRIASGRLTSDGVKITAVNPGSTYVILQAADVAVAVQVGISQSKQAPLLAKIWGEKLNLLQAGESQAIQLTGMLSDGDLVTDQEAMVRLVAAMQEEQQDFSGGWGGTQQGPVRLTYRSLTPEVVEVTDNGRVTARTTGLGRVKVSLGELSTVVVVPVGNVDVTSVITDISFDQWQVQLVDIYKHQLPSRRHWFGTDHQNRDIFSRVLVGTRQTLLIGFISVFTGTVIGTILGLLAGFYGGWLDNLLTRMCDVMLAFPGILLAIAVIAVLGPGLINIIFAVAIFTIPIFLRIVRGSTLELKNMTYVEAARSIGVKDYVIILRHIFPGTLSIVMVYLTMRIGTAILIGASLSFLGLGGDITAPEWGAMLSAAKDNSRTFFHPTFFPGLAIVITVLAFNILGDGLRDALDPKITD